MRVIREGTPPTKTVECCNCKSVLEVLYSDLTYQPMHEVSPTITQLGGYYASCPVCGCQVFVNWFDPIIIKQNDSD